MDDFDCYNIVLGVFSHNNLISDITKAAWNLLVLATSQTKWHQEVVFVIVAAIYRLDCQCHFP